MPPLSYHLHQLLFAERQLQISVGAGFPGLFTLFSFAVAGDEVQIMTEQIRTVSFSTLALTIQTNRTIRERMGKRKKNEGVDFSGLFSNDKSDSEKIQGFGVILEEISSNMKLVLEKTDSTEKSLKKEIRGVRTELKEDIHLLTMAVKSNKSEIIENRKAIEGNREAIEKLDARVGENTSAIEKLDARVCENTSSIENLDARVGENTNATEKLDARVCENTNAIIKNGKAIEKLGARVGENTSAIKTMDHKLDKINNLKETADDHEERITVLETSRI